MPRAVARRREGYTHEVEIDGHTIVVDEPTEAGGDTLHHLLAFLRQWRAGVVLACRRDG